jgi:acetone carboxylase gamma subunit
MNLEGIEKYEIPDFNEEATVGNTTQLAGAVLSMNKLEGEGWQTLREDLYQFCLTEIERGDPEDPCRVGDFAPKIWGFYKGYLACNSNYCRNIRKLIDSMPYPAKNDFRSVFLTE